MRRALVAGILMSSAVALAAPDTRSIDAIRAVVRRQADALGAC